MEMLIYYQRVDRLTHQAIVWQQLLRHYFIVEVAVTLPAAGGEGSNPTADIKKIKWVSAVSQSAARH